MLIHTILCFPWMSLLVFSSASNACCCSSSGDITSTKIVFIALLFLNSLRRLRDCKAG